MYSKCSQFATEVGQAVSHGSQVACGHSYVDPMSIYQVNHRFLEKRFMNYSSFLSLCELT